MSKPDQSGDWLEAILVTALREAYAYAYNKGQQHDQVPDHLQAEAIKRKAKAAIQSHLDAADRKTLETIAALLNGDENQVTVVRNYVWNKLDMYAHLTKDKGQKGNTNG